MLLELLDLLLFLAKLSFYPGPISCQDYCVTAKLIYGAEGGENWGKWKHFNWSRLLLCLSLSPSKSGNSNKTFQSRFKFCEKLINKEFDQTRSPAPFVGLYIFVCFFILRIWCWDWRKLVEENISFHVEIKSHLTKSKLSILR